MYTVCIYVSLDICILCSYILFAYVFPMSSSPGGICVIWGSLNWTLALAVLMACVAGRAFKAVRLGLRILSFSFVFFRFLSFSFVFWAPGRPSWTNEISKRSGRTLLRAKGARGALKLQLFVSGPWAIGFHVTHSFWNPCLQIVQPSLLIHKQKCRILYDVRAEYFINMCMRSLEIYAARPMGLIQVCI